MNINKVTKWCRSNGFVLRDARYSLVRNLARCSYFNGVAMIDICEDYEGSYLHINSRTGVYNSSLADIKNMGKFYRKCLK